MVGKTLVLRDLYHVSMEESVVLVISAACGLSVNLTFRIFPVVLTPSEVINHHRTFSGHVLENLVMPVSGPGVEHAHAFKFIRRFRRVVYSVANLFQSTYQHVIVFQQID